MDYSLSYYEKRKLDLEWVLLMKYARELGLEPDEVKSVLNQLSQYNEEKKYL